MDIYKDPNEGITDSAAQRYDMIVAHEELTVSIEQTLQSYYENPNDKTSEIMLRQIGETCIALLNIINNISQDDTMKSAEKAIYITELVMNDDERRCEFLSGLLGVERSAFPGGYSEKQETIEGVLAELLCEEDEDGPPVQGLIEHHVTCVQSDITNFMNQPSLRQKIENSKRINEYKAVAGRVCLQAIGTAAGVIIGGYILGKRKR